MEEETNDVIEETTDEEFELDEVEETDSTDWKAEAEKARGIAKRLKTKLEKAAKAESKVEKPGEKVEKTEPVKTEPKAGELDDAVLDFFELKGYSEADEIEVFRSIMQKTGMSHREVLKDDYALSKVKALQDEKSVSAALPSSTKRGSNDVLNNEDFWFQKYEQMGKLPENMPKGMAEKLINRKMGENDVRKNPYE
jgi:hypothetical protein